MSEPFTEKPLNTYKKPYPLFDQRLVWYRGKMWSEEELPQKLCYLPDPFTKYMKELTAKNKFVAFQF